MQSHARAVIVGGGAVGTNILYSLTRRGWTDVVLLERAELTSGSTWHAAGLIPLYANRYTHGRMILKTIEIYEGLEAETGQAVGWHKCGSLRLASDRDRLDEYLWHAGCAKTQGVEAHILTPQEVRKLWPLIENADRIMGGLYHPQDGHIAPADVTQALAKGARDKGAKIYRNTEALTFEQLPSCEWKITTSAGDIVCEHLVVATGNYAQRTARLLGISYPAIPVVHQYLITEEVPEIVARKKAGLPEMPILKDDRFIGYLREERQALMFGPYEAPDDLELFAVDGVPEWFGAMSLLPEKLDPVARHIEAAMDLVPAFGRVGVRSHVRGPICTTPDNLPLVGPAPGLRNAWLAEGVAGGIVMGGGLGHYLAEMIVKGEPAIDFVDYDPRRFGDHANKSYACIKSREAFGNNFGTFYPDYEWPAARPSKTPPCYERLKAHRAVFGAFNGWEVPVWYAPSGVEPRDEYGYRRTPYFEHVGNEARAVRSSAGLLEMTPMAKFDVEGPGAERWLDRLLANRLPKKAGAIRLCHLLTRRGTVKCEFTVVRLAADKFYLISSPRAETLNFDVLSGLLPDDGGVRLRNATLERGCFAVVGPKARDILQQMASVDLSNESFPWLTAQAATVGLASDVRMLRIDFEGELGWELYHPISYQRHLFDTIMEAGKPHGLKLVGNRAIDSLRLEKSYANIWRDLNGEYTAWESSLDRFIALNKGDFVGRDALIRQKEKGIERRLVTLKIETSDGPEALGNECVYRDGELVGRVTSANHAHHLGFNIALAYVPLALCEPGSKLQVPVLNEMMPAEVLENPPYDPAGRRSRM
jgi:dimethylglycine dehydrogenase